MRPVSEAVAGDAATEVRADRRKAARSSSRKKEIDAGGRGALLQAVREDFRDMDSDANGMISEAEMVKAERAPTARLARQMIKRADSDKDGQLSLDELARMLAPP